METLTSRLRKDIELDATKHTYLMTEIKTLQDQLNESKKGLLAAARISDQLESCQSTNSALKEECKCFYVVF